MSSENGITKMLGGAPGNSRKPTWSQIAVAVMFIGAFSGGFMMVGRFQQKVNDLEDDIVSIGQRLQKLQDWQIDWPSKGILSLDVGQNKEIENLLRRVTLLEQRAVKVEIVD